MKIRAYTRWDNELECYLLPTIIPCYARTFDAIWFAIAFRWLYFRFDIDLILKSKSK